MTSSPLAIGTHAALTLAQGGRAVINEEQQREIMFWLMIVVVIGIAIGLVGFVIWRRFKKQDQSTGEVEGFSLSQMRRMYENGEISHQEYVHVRDRLIGEARGAIEGGRKAEAQPPAGEPVEADEPGEPGAPNAPPPLPVPTPAPQAPAEAERADAPADRQSPRPPVRFINAGAAEFGSVTERALAVFESRHEWSLADDYRRFLLTHNGGTPLPSMIDFSRDGRPAFAAVQYIYGLHQGDDWASLEQRIGEFASRMPTGYMPVAADADGGQFVMSVLGPMTGRIYHWDASREHQPPTFDNMSFVAESFAAMLGKLRHEGADDAVSGDDPAANA